MTIRADIQIKASPERVWDILTRFDDYHRWNPFIPTASGEAIEGRAIRAFIRPPGTKGMQFRPRLLIVTPGRMLKWRGSVGVRGLFDGEHTFQITRLTAERVVFEQSETFSGLLAPFMTGKAFLDAAEQGFHMMNDALRARAERG